jgi:hypothetical protein
MAVFFTAQVEVGKLQLDEGRAKEGAEEMVNYIVNNVGDIPGEKTRDTLRELAVTVFNGLAKHFATNVHPGRQKMIDERAQAEAKLDAEEKRQAALLEEEEKALKETQRKQQEVLAKQRAKEKAEKEAIKAKGTWFAHGDLPDPQLNKAEQADL